MSLSKQSELFAIREARNNLIIHLFPLTTLKPSLPETISEALRKAPPEHLELALTVLTEARFVVWPRGHSDHCELTVNHTFEDGRISGQAELFEKTFGQAATSPFPFFSSEAQSPEPIADGPRLRVFGNVVQQLNAGNHVHILPIAIF
jgi:hypothetical protein